MDSRVYEKVDMNLTEVCKLQCLNVFLYDSVHKQETQGERGRIIWAKGLI